MYFSAILDFAKRLPISRHAWGRRSQAMNLMEQQGNKVKEIGFLLKEARSRTSLSLEEVAAETLLRTGLLSAIERGSLQELPEPIYIQALIRQYANFLGLDGDRLANSIPTKQIDLQGHDRQWSIFLPMLTQLRPMHLYAIYIVLIAIAVNSLSAMVENSKQDTAPIALPPIQEQVSNTTTKDKVPPSPSPVAKPSQPIVVNATLKAQSWVRVVADEQTLFEGVLDEGNQRTWTAKQKLSIRAGNAGALVVSFNENPPKAMGNIGEVQEVTFTPDSKSPTALNNQPSDSSPAFSDQKPLQNPDNPPTSNQTTNALPNQSPSQR